MKKMFWFKKWCIYYILKKWLHYRFATWQVWSRNIRSRKTNLTFSFVNTMRVFRFQSFYRPSLQTIHQGIFGNIIKWLSLFIHNSCIEAEKVLFWGRLFRPPSLVIFLHYCSCILLFSLLILLFRLINYQLEAPYYAYNSMCFAIAILIILIIKRITGELFTTRSFLL